MRIKCLLALLPLMMSIHVVAQNGADSANKKALYALILQGESESIKFRDVTPAGVTIVVKLQLEARNDGETPVVILTEEPPQIRAVILTKHPSDPFTKALVVDHWGASVDRSSKWSTLRTNLDQRSPPRDKVRFLKPNESWRFENEIHIFVPTESGKRSSFTKGASLETLQQYSPVWMKINWEVWPLNVEPWSNDRSKLNFGRTLQRRWKNVGRLWLDVIQSEPIKLDLKGIHTN